MHEVLNVYALFVLNQYGHVAFCAFWRHKTYAPWRAMVHSSK